MGRRQKAAHRVLGISCPEANAKGDGRCASVRRTTAKPQTAACLGGLLDDASPPGRFAVWTVCHHHHDVVEGIDERSRQADEGLGKQSCQMRKGHRTY